MSASIRDLDLTCCTSRLGDDSFHLEMPVAGETLGVEPNVVHPPANSLPSLRCLMHHLIGWQISEGRPVSVRRCIPVVNYHFVGIAQTETLSIYRMLLHMRTELLSQRCVLEIRAWMDSGASGILDPSRSRRVATVVAVPTNYASSSID